MIDKKRIFKSLIIISLIIIIIFTAIQIRKTLARYETTTTTQRDVDVAFWVVENSFQSQRLVIDDIYPVNTPFEYTFTVSNFNPGALESEIDDKIAETDMEYEIVLTTTTNLPLSYEIEKSFSVDGVTYTKIDNKYVDENGNEYEKDVYDDYNQELFADDDGTVYRKINFGITGNEYPLEMDTIEDGTNTKRKVIDTYTLKVTFPEQSTANGVTVNNRENLNYPDLMEDIKIELTARQKID